MGKTLMLDYHSVQWS